MSTAEHKKHADIKGTAGILSMSTSRSIAEDSSGIWIKQEMEKRGHTILFHRVLPDEAKTIQKTVMELVSDYQPGIVFLTGGTGISPKDVTVEAVRPLFQKEITAFGPLFSQLSYGDIGSAALLSRATAGIIDQSILFLLPGSFNACKMACNYLVFPEIGHLFKHMKE